MNDNLKLKWLWEDVMLWRTSPRTSGLQHEIEIYVIIYEIEINVIIKKLNITNYIFCHTRKQILRNVFLFHEGYGE